MTATLTPRRPIRLATPARDAAARAVLDRLTGTPVLAGWRKPMHPTFNSAV